MRTASSRPVSVKSAARVLDVLELVAPLGAGIGVNEIARRLHIPKSSASSLVATLAGRGYLSPGPDGYSLAERYRTGGWVGGATAQLARTAQPVMHRLAAATGESAYLGVATDALDIRYIAKAVSDNPLRYDADLVRLRPAHSTTIGYVLLAHLDEAARRRYLARTRLAAVTTRTVVDRGAIERALARTLRQGYAILSDGHVIGASGAAAPVFANGRVVAGLALIAPTARFAPERRKIIAAVVAAAVEISRLLELSNADAREAA